MKKTSLLVGAATALLLHGCATGGAKLPENTGKYSQEQNAKFVLMDSGAQRSITATGLQEGKTADGRLEIAALVRNRENRRLEVQVQCVFKDGQGYAVEETPFQTLILTENAQETMRFTATNAKAVNYTVRVRQTR
jgi:hypothetical protein